MKTNFIFLTNLNNLLSFRLWTLSQRSRKWRLLLSGNKDLRSLKQRYNFINRNNVYTFCIYQNPVPDPDLEIRGGGSSTPGSATGTSIKKRTTAQHEVFVGSNFHRSKKIKCRMKINLRPKKLVANNVTTTSYKYYGNAIKSLPSLSKLVFFLNQLSQDKETAVSPAQNAINKRLVVDCAKTVTQAKSRTQKLMMVEQQKTNAAGNTNNSGFQLNIDINCYVCM